MNPVIILFSLGVWYILWGTVGAPLAPLPPPLAAPRQAARRIAPRPLPACPCSGKPPGVVVARCRCMQVHAASPLWRAQARCWPCL